MQWWFWPIGAVIIVLFVFCLNRWTRFGEYKISTLDIIVVPLWLILHFTMGYRFGVSWIFWLLLAWCFVGIILSWFLLHNKWHWRAFWHKYWQWSGLLSIVLLISVTIFGLLYHSF